MTSSIQPEPLPTDQQNSILRNCKNISTTLTTASTSPDPFLYTKYSQEQGAMAPSIATGLKTAIVQPGMFHKGPFSLEVPDKFDEETIPRRNAKYMKELVSQPASNISTLYDALKFACHKYGEAPALGSRKLIREYEKIFLPTCKPRKTYELGEYDWTSYTHYFGLFMDIGRGLRQLGLKPGDRLHIFAATSKQWLAMSHGAATQSLPIVTSYASLGEAGLKTSLVQTRAKAIFLDSNLLLKLKSVLKKATDVKLVIYNGDSGSVDEDIKTLKGLYPYLKICPFHEVVRLGTGNPIAATPPSSDDLCCIMYTSGTTGSPKGVPLKHRNVVAAMAGIKSVFDEYIGPTDSVLAYLPLAHSFEYAFENTCLFLGVKIGYGTARTMLDNNMENCKGDIRELQPTILVGVPAVWNLVKKGIRERVDKQGRFSKWLFSSALKLKTWLCRAKLPGPGLLDKLVFNKVKEQFGSRLRACFNGAGPLSKEDRSFISHTVAPLLSGYGLTETCAMGALQDPLEWTNNTLGDIPACIEIKLVDYPEGNYFAKDNRGEIWIRGDAVMDGYYENPEETKKAMEPGGWFKTGDIGAWAPNGHLELLDRKKNLIKTSAGEYVAMEHLESIYRASPIVSNVCIYATGAKRSILAIVVPRKEAVEQYYRRLAPEDARIFEGKNYNLLVKESRINSWILENLKREAKKANLMGAEIISAVILTEKEWTNENGLLTPAQKLQRRLIWPLFEKEIEDAYRLPNVN